MFILIITMIAYYPIVLWCRAWPLIRDLPNGFTHGFVIFIIATLMDTGLAYGMADVGRCLDPPPPVSASEKKIQKAQQISSGQTLQEIMACHQHPALPYCSSLQEHAQSILLKSFS